jgi:hypothetical protein
MIHSQETSVWGDIAYLDPELNSSAGLLEAELPVAATWNEVRRFVFSPCVVTLAAFLALLIIGVRLAD